jgi:hypothetical protein
MKKKEFDQFKNEAIGSNFTLAQALNMVLTNKFRSLGNDFTDAEGNKFSVHIYRCSVNLVRADFQKPKEKK